MNGFTFYKSFYDTIKKIRKPCDRANAILAICEYMFEDKEPDDNVSETVAIVFQSVKHTLKKSKSNGEKNKSNESQNEVKTQSDDNQTKVKTKSNESQNEVKRETRLSSSLRLSSYTPPFIPPQGEKQKVFAEAFFDKYPRYAKAKYQEGEVDFERLLVEFEKSAYLRSLYTFKQVLAIYPAIIKGDFRDKKDEKTEAADARADRERWYADRRAAAERKADNVKAQLMKDKKFFEINGRLSTLEIEVAKAEIEDDERLQAQLAAEKEDLLELRLEILKKHKYVESDLQPVYYCERCSDTGYLPNGKMCNCYTKEK